MAYRILLWYLWNQGISHVHGWYKIILRNLHSNFLIVLLAWRWLPVDSKTVCMKTVYYTKELSYDWWLSFILWNLASYAEKNIDGGLLHAVFTLEPTTCPILSQMNPDWNFSSSFCRIYFNLTHISTPGSLNLTVSVRLLHQNDVSLSLLAFTCCMPCPSHSSSFDTQIMILRITNHETLHYLLFPSPLLLPVWLNTFLRTLFLNT